MDYYTPDALPSPILRISRIPWDLGFGFRLLSAAAFCRNVCPAVPLSAGSVGFSSRRVTHFLVRCPNPRAQITIGVNAVACVYHSEGGSSFPTSPLLRASEIDDCNKNTTSSCTQEELEVPRVSVRWTIAIRLLVPRARASQTLTCVCYDVRRLLQVFVCMREAFFRAVNYCYGGALDP